MFKLTKVMFQVKLETKEIGTVSQAIEYLQLLVRMETAPCTALFTDSSKACEHDKVPARSIEVKEMIALAHSLRFEDEEMPALIDSFRWVWNGGAINEFF